MAPAGGGTDDLVPSVRWQESEDSMRGVRGVICNASGFADAAVIVRGIDGA